VPKPRIEFFLLRNDFEIESESLQHRFESYGPGPCSGVKTMRSVLAPIRTPGSTISVLEPLHIGFIDIFPQRRDASSSIFRERFIALTV